MPNNFITPRDSVPLCVDLDGTLVNTDMLHESILILVKKNPLILLSLFKWLFKGPAFFKARVSEDIVFDVTNLPFNSDVLNFIDVESKKKRDIYLVTATNQKIADRVFSHLTGFTGIMCSTESLNMKGHNKAQALINRFGEKNFDYIGNSNADIPIFERSRNAYFVAPNNISSRQFDEKYGTKTISIQAPSWKFITKALRLHQWAKNLLIFLPLVLAHKFTELNLWITSLISFMCFSLCASGVYVINDLLDLEADRKHHSKRHRPFASGKISIAAGIITAFALFGCSFILSFLLTPWPFSLALSAYLIFTTLYSFRLKELLIVDAISLGILYTSRIVAGHAATEIPMSHWLLTFSLFIFLSLAFLKRSSELFNLKVKDLNSASGRAYVVNDLPIVQIMGASSGFISVLVFILYLDSSKAKDLYAHPFVLSLIIPALLYWIGRAWALAGRGQINEDPILWAIKDHISHFVFLIICVLFYCAQ